MLAFSFFIENKTYSQQINILALGNSITWGTNAPPPDPNEAINTAYRYKLYQLLNEAGYVFDFIGSRSSGYNYFNDAEHCGIPGARGRHIQSILKTGFNSHPRFQVYECNGPYLNFFPADIILLELGINDVIADDVADLSEFDSIFGEIDKYERTSGKPVLVFVSQILSTKNENGSCNANAKINEFNLNLKNLVNKRINNGDKLVLVDLQCNSNIDYKNDMLDLYHPNLKGYEKIGQAFFAAIDKYNSAPDLLPIPNQTTSEGIPFAEIYLDDYVNDKEDKNSDIVWAINQTNNISVTINNRVVNVTPKNPDWYGSDTITFTATDNGKVIPGLKKSESVNVLFTVIPVNDPPEILSQKTILEVEEDEFFVLKTEYLNIFDPDNLSEELNLIIHNGNNYTFNTDTVKPMENFNGFLQVNITANDSLLSSDTFKVLVTVTPVNDPPLLIFPDLRSVKVGTKYSTQIRIIDIDENENLTITPIEIPDWLSFNPATQYIEGTPSEKEIGNHTLTFSGSDGLAYVDSVFVLEVIYSSNIGDNTIENLSIYFSPDDSKFHVNIGEYSGNAVIAVYTLQGIKTKEETIHFEQGSGIIDLTVLKSGVYIAGIIVDEKIYAFKFIKL